MHLMAAIMPHPPRSIPGVDVFTVVFGGLLAFFVIVPILLGLFSQRSPRDYLDWKPTRSPEVEIENDVDDVAQMLEAQNERRRRRGLPDRTEEEIAAEVRRDHADLTQRAAAWRAREERESRGS
jgi:hypothetical protein